MKIHTLLYVFTTLVTVLFTRPVICANHAWERDKVCRDRAFRCVLQCNEDTPGGSMARLQCYSRCTEQEHYCRVEPP